MCRRGAGAALLTLVAQALEGAGALEQILFGGAIVAAMLLLPDGLYGAGGRLLRRCRGDERAARRAGPVAPVRSACWRSALSFEVHAGEVLGLIGPNGAARAPRST